MLSLSFGLNNMKTISTIGWGKYPCSKKYSTIHICRTTGHNQVVFGLSQHNIMVQNSFTTSRKVEHYVVATFWSIRIWKVYKHLEKGKTFVLKHFFYYSCLWNFRLGSGENWIEPTQLNSSEFISGIAEGWAVHCFYVLVRETIKPIATFGQGKIIFSNTIDYMIYIYWTTGQIQ